MHRRGSSWARGAETPSDVESEEVRYVSELEEHLGRAVTDCLPRAGRVALALSGGKDSSSLAVVLSKICPDRVLAFNVGSTNVLHDEESDAALVAKSLGLAFKPYVPTGRRLAEGLHHFLAVQGQPIGDLGGAAVFPRHEGPAGGLQVVLDGTGNDFYFGIPSVEKGAHRYGRRRQIEGNLPPAAWKTAPAADGARSRIVAAALQVLGGARSRSRSCRGKDGLNKS